MILAADPGTGSNLAMVVGGVVASGSRQIVQMFGQASWGVVARMEVSRAQVEVVGLVMVRGYDDVGGWEEMLRWN
jgi:hypothetical protein